MVDMANIKQRVEAAQAGLVLALRDWDDWIKNGPSATIVNPATGESKPISIDVSQYPTTASPVTMAPKPRRVIPWGAAVGPEFLESCLWIEQQLGLKVENLMPCMKFESNLNPKARNPMSSGTGLIQFMESTARRLGTTTALLAEMSAVRQLSYVYKYFKEYKDRGFKLHNWTVEDTYMSILWPAGIGKPDDYRIFIDDPNKVKDAYDVNKGLDLDKDGFITKREACARVVRLANEGTTPANAGFM